MLAHLRAEAAALKGLALARLTQDYAAKIADVLQNAPADQVIARLHALAREHQQTKRAVMARMTSEAAAKRRFTAHTPKFINEYKSKASEFMQAAKITTNIYINYRPPKKSEVLKLKYILYIAVNIS